VRGVQQVVRDGERRLPDDYVAVFALDLVFPRFNSPIDHWKGPYQSLVIGFASQITGCGSLCSIGTVVDRQPNERKAIANVIAGPPPETADRFEHRIVNLTDDFGWL
jgi:hypothetical protein